ncbi:UNVERIFIED_CONTAM: Zinc finger CCCH domain-containing protein 33 [Sesamum calycinum]
MNSRSTAFTKRSQSFIDRAGVSYHPSLSGSANSPSLMPSKLSDWSSPNGKLDWGFNGDEANKLRKSASFGIRSGNAAAPAAMISSNIDEPDVSWVNSLVKDVPSGRSRLYSAEQKHGGVHDIMPRWADQMYMEQEQMVA